MPRVRVFAAAIVLIVAANAFAAKTDVVVLKNGDHFTGEVKQLSSGQLKLSTDDAGTIYIEWDKIASVTTALQYEVVTMNGSRYVGMLAPESADQIRVVAEDGTARLLKMADVVSFASIKTGWLERIDGSLDVGGTYTKSSGVAQTSVDLTTAYRRPRYEVFTDFESNVTRQRESPTTSRFTLKSGYVHFRTDDWIVSPFVFVERNEDLGLTLRSIAALTAGTYLHRSGRSSTLVMAGAAAGRERSIDGDAIPDFDALVTLTTSFYRYDYPHSAADLAVMIFPELNRWGRVRVNVHAKLKYELFRDFYVATTIYDTFDSRPQVRDVSRNDIGLALSIGWTF